MGGNDLNMVFYGEYSVRVRTHALLCAIYGDLYSHGAHGAVQINHSIRKDQGQARIAGAGWLMTIAVLGRE